MSSDATPKSRKRLMNRRERKPTRPARTGHFDDVESSPADTRPASDPGSFIETVTKDDPTASRQPSVQKEPPRAPGP